MTAREAALKIAEFGVKWIANQVVGELRCNTESKRTLVNGRCVSQSLQLGHCHNSRWLEKPHSLH